MTDDLSLSEDAFIFGDGVMKKETKQEGGCDCFMCRHGKDKRILKAYLIGFLEQTESTLNALQEAGITTGKINDNDLLRRLYAELKYNKEATGCFLSELEDVVL